MTLTPSREHRIFSRSFSQADGSNDDNIIRNVSLITRGTAKGHDTNIDDTTITQVLDCAQRFKNGVRANLDHFTGLEKSFGHLVNLRNAGDKLLADLNLFSEFPNISLLKKQILTIPDTFGFSLFFNGPDEEKTELIEGKPIKVKYARCEELFSADLVGEPAANPSGVFSINGQTFIQGPTVRGQIDNSTVDNKKKNMAEETPDLKKTITECMAEILKPHAERMEEISKRVDGLCTKMEIGKNDTPVKVVGPGEKPNDKPSSPNVPLSAEDEAKKKEEEEKKKLEDEKAKEAEEEKKMSRFRAGIMDDLMKALSQQKISPPATATVTSPASEKGSDTKPECKTFHEACRSIHALSNGAKTKTDCMRLAAQQYPELHKAYCAAQENGEAWTREALFMTPEKKQRNLSIIASGRLI